MRKRMFILFFGIIFLTVTGAYAQGQDLVVKGETALATDEGFLGIGTEDPARELHIKEIAGDPQSHNRPRITMEDYGGDAMVHEIDTGNLGDITLQYYFPCNAGYPSWGMVMKVDDDQNIEFRGDMYLDCQRGGETPRTQGVKLGLGITADTGIQTEAPDGTDRFIDAHDIYVRKESDWISNHMPTTHMAKMEMGQSSLSMPDGSYRKVDFDTVIFDKGGIADITNDRFKVKKDGIYLVVGSWWCKDFRDADKGNQETRLFIQLRVNGWTVGNAVHEVIGHVMKSEEWTDNDTPIEIDPDDPDGFVSVTDVFKLNEGDTVEMCIWHSGGETSNSTYTTLWGRPRMSLIQMKDLSE